LKESDFNRVLFRAFNIDNGFGYKISDQSFGKKPFDGFAVIKGTSFYIESKLMKSNLGSFRFNLLEDHQHIYLDLIARNSNNQKDKIIPCVAIAYYHKKIPYGFFLFDYKYIKRKINEGITSIKKKELQIFFDNDKKEFNLTNIKIKCIISIQICYCRK